MTEQGSEPRPPSARLLWLVVVLLLVGAGALWAASEVVWGTQWYRTPFSGDKPVELSGAQLRPELVPFALATLAAGAAVLATGGWLRRIVGLLVAVAGGFLVQRAFTAGEPAGGGPGVPEGSEPLGAVSTSLLGSSLMTAGGLVLVAAGLLVAVRARRMPAMGAKYSAPGAKKPRIQDPDRRLWEALDEGADPTTDDRDR